MHGLQIFTLLDAVWKKGSCELCGIMCCLIRPGDIKGVLHHDPGANCPICVETPLLGAEWDWMGTSDSEAVDDSSWPTRTDNSLGGGCDFGFDVQITIEESLQM